VIPRPDIGRSPSWLPQVLTRAWPAATTLEEVAGGSQTVVNLPILINAIDTDYPNAAIMVTGYYQPFPQITVVVAKDLKRTRMSTGWTIATFFFGLFAMTAYLYTRNSRGLRTAAGAA
jgi:hypothetical protein